jgi:hypothetical protein
MLDPKTISVTVNNDQERDFACRWFERQGLKKKLLNEDWPYPYQIADYCNNQYTNYVGLFRQTNLTFSFFIAQVEPQVGDWVECVIESDFGYGTCIGQKFRISALTIFDTYQFEGHYKKEYDRNRFKVCLPPEEKETTGEIKEIIGYRHRASGKEFQVKRDWDGITVFVKAKDSHPLYHIEKWQLPDYEPIYAPTKPKPITLFLGSKKKGI